MNATGKRRLLKLADFLETADLGRGKFEMDLWASGLTNDDGDPIGKKLGDCGTAACAFGWATTIPSFRRAGLQLDPQFLEPMLEGKWSATSSARQFFDLSLDQVERLFLPSDMDGLTGKRGRRIVAKRIRDLVKRSSRLAEIEG